MMSEAVSLNKRILNLTIPNIVTNITVPLLGMVDLAIIGHINGGSHIGAVAIGSAIFNLLYWNFGFLRMGTTGLAAQALGAHDLSGCANCLVRSAMVGLVIGLLFLLLQIPLFFLAKSVMNISDSMMSGVMDYFYIRIWAAPATLALYTIKGWFLGMQNSKLPMIIAIIINVVNILFSILFAYQLDMGMKGVALGTLLAQYSGMAVGVVMILRYYRDILRLLNFKEVFRKANMSRYFRVHTDILFRSTCLVIVFTFFTSASSKMGDDILNANTLLLQLFTLFSYVMDGFAYAGESITGLYCGAVNVEGLKRTIRYLIFWSIGITILFTAIYGFGLRPILSLFTNNSSIIDFAMTYRYWVTAVPVCGFLAFLYDGVAGGMLRTVLMRNTIFIAMIIFFIVYFGLKPFIGNNALWIAFLMFLTLRGVLMAIPLHQRTLKRMDVK